MDIPAEISFIQTNCEKLIENSKVITAISSLIRIDLTYTDYKKLSVCFRYPEKYPDNSILIELKSKTLSPKLLQCLTTMGDLKAKEYLGKPQIIHVTSFLATYLTENSLCVVYDEIANLKKLLADTSGSEIKLKQKTSCVSLCASGGKYFFKTKVTVPKLYPAEGVSWNNFESNLPVVLVRFLNGQAKEISRKCVEPPLNPPKGAPPFTVQPSLYKTLSFLIEATNDFCIEICPICLQKCLPENPSDVILNDNDDMYVERVLCGHVYHQGCLKKYLREPPFVKAGKPCPALKRHARADTIPYSMTAAMANQNKKSKAPSTACSLPLHHDRWGLSPKLAEARWANKQARARELEEVKDFLQ
ncbi:hypothetical protein HA402_013426 [Bradysia odoriphaga]|nr:hypothetical protein HA402_013426 [Bradysia odoriphaga]